MSTSVQSVVKGFLPEALQAQISRLASSAAIPLVIGALLSVSAASKAYAAATQDPTWLPWFHSHWVMAVWIPIELALGLALLAGLWPQTVRNVALLVFVVLFEAALYEWVDGARHCACFGKVALPPWAAVLIDVFCLGLLALWRPAASAPPGRLGSGVLAAVAVGSWVYVWSSIWDYAPKGPIALLRHDLFLVSSVKIDLPKASAADVVKIVSERRFVPLAIDERLAPETIWLGTVRTKATAFALLELVAEKAGGARWIRDGDGYRLVPAGRVGSAMGFAVVAFLHLATGLAYRVVQGENYLRPVSQSPRGPMPP